MAIRLELTQDDGSVLVLSEQSQVVNVVQNPTQPVLVLNNPNTNVALTVTTGPPGPPGTGGGEGGGVTDHGALTGLGDDDHPQYLNVFRGDLRYYTQSQLNTMLAGKQASGDYAALVHNHDDRYFTEGEVNALLGGKADSGHTHDDRYYTESEVDTKLSTKSNAGHTHISTNVTDFAEAVQDVLGTDLVGGTNVTVSYNDTTGKVTLSSVNTTDHGALSGLSDDDHPQYHNNTRGDARYYQKTEVDTALSGKVSTTDPRLSDARTPTAHTHGIADINATGTRNDTVFLRGDGTWASPPNAGGGVTDHGALTGLADDDHPQYLNNTRGDARYYTQAQVDTALSGKSSTGHTHTSTNITDFNTAVDSRIQNVVGAAPAALDTLEELAAALGDDANFAGTVTTQLANKSDVGHGHAIGDVTGLQTALDGKQPAGSYVTTADARLTDQRVPTDLSVTNAKVSTTAAINADKLADGTTNKIMTAAERTKLTGIATGATANSTDATLLSRANHTGTQAISTVTGLQTALDSKQAAGSYVVEGDARLTDARTPSDSSVTNVKVATNAAINADKLADGTTNKVLTATERTKLAGIATGATANSSDATLLNRANHTGTQAASTISDLNAAVESLVGGMIQAGTNISVDYDVDLGTVTISSSAAVNYSSLPAGVTLTINQVTTGTIPNRPTSRTDIFVIWQTWEDPGAKSLDNDTWRVIPAP